MQELIGFYEGAPVRFRVKIERFINARFVRQK
jgi:hypothetical protein